MPALVQITGWEVTRERINGKKGKATRIFVRTNVGDEDPKVPEQILPSTQHPEEFDFNRNQLEAFGSTDGERSPKILSAIQEQADVRHFNWLEAQSNAPFTEPINVEDAAAALGLKSPVIRIEKTFKERGEKPPQPDLGGGLTPGMEARRPKASVSPLGTELDDESDTGAADTSGGAPPNSNAGGKKP